MLYKITGLLLFAGILFNACKKSEDPTVNSPQQPNNIPYVPPKWDRKDIPTAGNFCDIQMMNHALAYACDSKGQFWRTTDSGNNWIKTFTVSPVEIINALYFINNATGFAITAGRIYKTTDSGSSWQQVAASFEGRDIFFTSLQTGYHSSNSAIYKTTNGGVTWQWIRNADFAKLHFTDGRGWYNDKYGRLYTTLNEGVNWSLLNAPASVPQSIFAYGLHAYNTQHVAAGRVNALRITQTGAAPFSNITDTVYAGATTSVHYTAPGQGFMITDKMRVAAFKLPDTLVRGQQILSNGPLNEMSFTDSVTGMICGDYGLILRFRKP